MGAKRRLYFYHSDLLDAPIYWRKTFLANRDRVSHLLRSQVCGDSAMRNPTTWQMVIRNGLATAEHSLQQAAM